jgi:hypothetical protein
MATVDGIVRTLIPLARLVTSAVDKTALRCRRPMLKTCNLMKTGYIDGGACSSNHGEHFVRSHGSAAAQQPRPNPTQIYL